MSSFEFIKNLIIAGASVSAVYRSKTLTRAWLQWWVDRNTLVGLLGLFDSLVRRSSDVGTKKIRRLTDSG